MITLYDYPASPNSRKVRIALSEKGLTYEKRFIDISKGEQRSEAYLAVNPNGKLPSIQHTLESGQQVTIYDSTIINEYLEDAFPDAPRLFPADAFERAQTRTLEDWADRMLIEPVGVLFAQNVFSDESRRNRARIDEARMRCVELLRRLEKQLDDRRSYLIGDYSIADVALTPHLAYAEQFGVPFNDLLPRVAEWYVRLKNRPSFLA